MKPVKKSVKNKKPKPKKKRSQSNTQILSALYDNEMSLTQIINQLGAILTEIKFVSQHIIEQITKGPLSNPTPIPEPSKPQVLPKEPIDWFKELERRRKQNEDKRKQIDPWIDYPSKPTYPDWPQGPYDPLTPGLPRRQPIITCNVMNPLS